MLPSAFFLPLDPACQRIQQFGSNLGILASRARRHVKRMIRILKQLECGAGTELLAERFDERQVRQSITSSLQEQHRNLHVGKVRSALVRRLPSGMKRESEKHEAAPSGQRRGGLRLWSHPSATGG